jgi:hypothetical protein
MNNIPHTTRNIMVEAQTEMPVHEKLIDLLDDADSQEDRNEIIRAWTQEEIDHKRDIYEMFARSSRDS